jgi:hypothetical protein
MMGADDGAEAHTTGLPKERIWKGVLCVWIAQRFKKGREVLERTRGIQGRNIKKGT